MDEGRVPGAPRQREGGDDHPLPAPEGLGIGAARGVLGGAHGEARLLGQLPDPLREQRGRDEDEGAARMVARGASRRRARSAASIPWSTSGASASGGGGGRSGGGAAGAFVAAGGGGRAAGFFATTGAGERAAGFFAAAGAGASTPEKRRPARGEVSKRRRSVMLTLLRLMVLMPCDGARLATTAAPNVPTRERGASLERPSYPGESRSVNLELRSTPRAIAAPIYGYCSPLSRRSRA